MADILSSEPKRRIQEKWVCMFVSLCVCGEVNSALLVNVAERNVNLIYWDLLLYSEGMTPPLMQTLDDR